MTAESDLFPAKILLTGEFTVIDGGIALAFPSQSLYGFWDYKPGQIDHRLIPFARVLSKLEYLDSQRFLHDVDHGLSFNSSIPEGYGMGSSGALSAGVLKKYHTQKIDDLDMIQKRLADIEHYFHGTSSGFDPLISYSGQAILVAQGMIKILSEDQWKGNPFLNKFYLLDSMIPRESISPIDWYFAQKQIPSFLEIIPILNSLNKKLIDCLIRNDQVTGTVTMKQISQLQLDFFKPLIVDSVLEFWHKGLAENTYYTKLCGKGGGGFYLVYMTQDEKAHSSMPPLLKIC